MGGGTYKYHDNYTIANVSVGDQTTNIHYYLCILFLILYRCMAVLSWYVNLVI